MDTPAAAPRINLGHYVHWGWLLMVLAVGLFFGYHWGHSAGVSDECQHLVEQMKGAIYCTSGQP